MLQSKIYPASGVLGCILLLLGLHLGLAEPTESNLAERYQVIIDRNPFGLKPPPPPPTNNPAAEKIAPSNIKLTGITSEEGSKLAWLVITESKGNKYLTVSEGDGQDGIEVLRINQKEAIVTIRQGGSTMDVTFPTNAPSPPGKGAPPPPTAGASNPAMPIPVPGGPKPAGVGGPVIVGRGGVVSTSTVNPAMPQPTAVPQAGVISSSVPTATAGSTAIPSRIVRTQTETAQTPSLSPEAQYLMMQATKTEAESRGIPMPPLPPIPGQGANIPSPTSPNP